MSEISDFYRPPRYSPLRAWVSRWARWIASVALMILVNGWWQHSYDVVAIGSILALFAIWGMRLHADDQPDTPFRLRLVYLRPLTWGLTIVLVLCGLIKLFDALGI